MPAYSSGCTELGRGACQLTWRRPPFLFPLTIPKTAEQTPQAGLSYLLLHLVQPLSQAGKLLHLRFAVLFSEAPVSVMVHPLRPLREWLHHARAPSEPLPYGLRPAKSPVHPILPLALVG